MKLLIEGHQLRTFIWCGSRTFTLLLIPTLAAFLLFSVRSIHTFRNYIFIAGSAVVLFWLSLFFGNQQAVVAEKTQLTKLSNGKKLDLISRQAHQEQVEASSSILHIFIAGLSLILLTILFGIDQ
jgi:hypothetical protein